MTVTPIGLHHVGLTVKDLDRSLRFYEDMFGLRPVFDVRSEGPALSDAVGVPDAKLRFAFLHIGDAELELLEYANDRDTSYSRRNCDVGAPHLCLHVVDLEASYRELKAKGVSFYAPPLHITDGPLAGCSFTYLRDPDGITVELFETPAVSEAERA